MRNWHIPVQLGDVAAWALDLLWMMILVGIAMPHRWVVVAILVGMGYLLHRLGRWPIWVSVLLTVIFSVVGYAISPEILTIALVVLGILWGYLAQVQTPQRTMTWALVIAMAEAIYRGNFWWVPWIVLMVGLMGFTLKSSREGSTPRVHGVVASLTGLVALVIAGAVAGILWLIPWVWIVQNTVGRVAAGLVSLVPLLHIHPRHPKKSAPIQGHLPKALHAANHTEPVIIGVLLVMLVMGLIWFLWKLLRQVDVEQDHGEETESFIIREHLAGMPSSLPFFERALLSPVRQVVHRRLRRLRGKPHARHRGETLRQWARRVYGKEFEAITAYEGVRYGNVPDTETLAKKVEKNWSEQNVIE